jgi:hypothetical protein
MDELRQRYTAKLHWELGRKKTVGFVLGNVEMNRVTLKIFNVCEAPFARADGGLERFLRKPLDTMFYAVE